jgi:hypothetical protein
MDEIRAREPLRCQTESRLGRPRDVRRGGLWGGYPVANLAGPCATLEMVKLQMRRGLRRQLVV